MLTSDKVTDCHLRSVKPYQGQGQEENLATNLNTSGQSDGELRATSFLYDHLLDKLVIKEKVSKGIKKSSFKWTGTTESLKDFVTLVLKKIGTWYKPKRKSISFKTANLTFVFYRNQSLRFHGKDTDKTKDRLASLKNMQLLPLPRQDTHSFTLGPLSSAANTTPSNNVTGLVMFADRPNSENFSESESADTDSFSSDYSMDSEDTRSPIAFNPDTPATTTFNINDKLSAYETIGNCNSIEDQLEKLRQGRHIEWLYHKQNSNNVNTPYHYDHSEPLPFADIQTENSVILKTLMCTNSLIENLDIKAICQLLQRQIDKTEELHDLIREKDKQIMELQQNLEERKINLQPKKPNKVAVNLSDEITETTWIKPKITHKPTLPPTWNPPETSNKFTILQTNDPQPDTTLQTNDPQPDTRISPQASLEIRKENIKLQRQVQYLQSRVANSKPENAVYTNPQRINSKENDSAKPKQHTDGVHAHSNCNYYGSFHHQLSR